MSYFTEYLKRTDDRLITKWLHYLDVYQREFGAMQGRNVTFLEIGVFKGGSIPMWKGFFGPESRLIFADIDPACKNFAEPGTTVEIGDQSDPEFLKHLGENYGPFDAVVDDGGHQMYQQIASFEHLWPYLRDRGLYLVEDVHTSYWPGFGGGYKNEKSFIEYAKDIVDKMHSWYTDEDEIFPLDDMARQVNSVRFYDSIVAIEKEMKQEPPLTIVSQNGKIEASRRALQVRGRKSVFKP